MEDIRLWNDFNLVFMDLNQDQQDFLDSDSVEMIWYPWIEYINIPRKVNLIIKDHPKLKRKKLHKMYYISAETVTSIQIKCAPGKFCQIQALNIGKSARK